MVPTGDTYSNREDNMHPYFLFIFSPKLKDNREIEHDVAMKHAGNKGFGSRWKGGSREPASLHKGWDWRQQKKCTANWKDQDQAKAKWIQLWFILGSGRPVERLIKGLKI